jgi:hypothetical protein
MGILIKKIQGSKGDALDIEFTVDQDITGWEIRCEVWDSSRPTTLFIQKGSPLVSGGSSAEIEFTNPTGGVFVIHILSGETTSFKGDINIEIETTDTSGGITTIFRDFLILRDQKITWTAAT